MSRKFGALGLMLTAGLLFIHPSLGNAQERYDRGSYYYYNYDRGGNRDYRDYRDYDRQRIQGRTRSKEVARERTSRKGKVGTPELPRQLQQLSGLRIARLRTTGTHTGHTDA